MARLMIDSSVLIDLERKGHDPDDVVKAYPDPDFAVAAITISELLFGAHHADSEQPRQQREAFVQRILQNLTVLPFGIAHAQHHAATWFHLQRAGQMIKAHDLLIAATALAEQAAVLTRDVRDFTRVPGLDIKIFDLSLLDER